MIFKNKNISKFLINQFYLGTVVSVFAEGKLTALAVGKAVMSTKDIAEKNKEQQLYYMSLIWSLSPTFGICKHDPWLNSELVFSVLIKSEIDLNLFIDSLGKLDQTPLINWLIEHGIDFLYLNFSGKDCYFFHLILESD